MSRVGKIILVNNYANPHVIIVDKPNCVRALEFTNNVDSRRAFELKEDEIKKIKYRGKKLEGRTVDLASISGVYSLNLREIGVLSEPGYFKLLKELNCFHACYGKSFLGYASIREDVQDQILELGKKLAK